MRRGEAVVARYEADNLWYRAEVAEDADESQEAVAIIFVDFGHGSVVSRRQLSDEAVPQLLHVPVLVLAVTPDLRPVGGSWSRGALDTLHQHVEGHNLQLEVRRRGSPLVVDMRMDSGDTLEDFVIRNNLGSKTVCNGIIEI